MKELNTMYLETTPIEVCDIDRALVFGEYPKLPFSEQMVEAVKAYDNLGKDTRKNMLEHCEAIIGVAQSFAGMEIPPLAIVATYLHDLIDRQINLKSHKSTPERQEAARKSIKELLAEVYPLITSEQLVYLGGILTSFVLAEIASGDHRKGVVDKATFVGDINQNNIRDKIAGLYDGELGKDDWETIEPYLDFSHIHKVAKRLNIESIVIKGCELLVNLRNPASERQSAWLQDVLEAESFYAPILEVLGYDGLASALRGQSHIVRLNGQGKRDIVERAESIIDKISQKGVNTVLSRIFGDSNSATHPVVGVDSRNDNKKPVEMGEFVAVLDEKGSSPVAGVYRLKTAGSLANKMVDSRYDGRLPMDILGITIISGGPIETSQGVKESIDDVRQSARDFAKFIKSKVIDGKLSMKKAESHKKPVVVKGSDKYISIVAEELIAQGVDLANCEFVRDSKEDRRRRGFAQFSVSKVTFLADLGDGDESVPVEAQFVTKAERERSRTGEVAHIVYKYIKQIEKTSGDKKLTDKERLEIVHSATKLLKEMHARRSYLNPNSLELNERTVEEGADYILSMLLDENFSLAV